MKSMMGSAKVWWEALESREQLSLKVMVSAIVVFIGYFGLWQPAQSYMQDQASLVEERKELLALVQSSKNALSQSASQNSSAASMNSQQLVSAVTNLARSQNLNLKRFEPSGENSVKVWVEDVPFDILISWLGRLEQSMGVSVEQISVERQEKSGVVSARLTLAS